MIPVLAVAVQAGSVRKGVGRRSVKSEMRRGESAGKGQGVDGPRNEKGCGIGRVWEMRGNHEMNKRTLTVRNNTHNATWTSVHVHPGLGLAW